MILDGSLQGRNGKWGRGGGILPVSNKKPLNFHTWAEKGITHLKHIFRTNTLATFPYLVQEYGIGRNKFLEYLQIQSSIQSKINIKSINLSLPHPTADLIDIPSQKKNSSPKYTK